MSPGLSRGVVRSSVSPAWRINSSSERIGRQASPGVSRGVLSSFDVCKHATRYSALPPAELSRCDVNALLRAGLATFAAPTRLRSTGFRPCGFSRHDRKKPMGVIQPALLRWLRMPGNSPRGFVAGGVPLPFIRFARRACDGVCIAGSALGIFPSQRISPRRA